MKNTIERIPLPLAGPMLGFAAMGIMIENYSVTLKSVCGAMAVCLLILLLLKTGTCLDMVKEELEDPVNCSISGAFSMGLLVLTVYIKPYVGGCRFYLVDSCTGGACVSFGIFQRTLYIL